MAMQTGGGGDSGGMSRDEPGARAFGGVLGFGFRVSGLEFRVWALGFRV